MAIRTKKKLSHFKFQQLSGVGRGKIQAIEAGKRDISVPDMDSWLAADGSSIAEYFAQEFAISHLKVAQEYKLMLEQVRRCLKDPDKRKALKAFLDMASPVEK